jgi:hypothetical protein
MQAFPCEGAFACFPFSGATFRHSGLLRRLSAAN